jgi:thioredoxin-related protein
MKIEKAVMTRTRLHYFVLFFGLILFVPPLGAAEHSDGYLTAEGLHTEPWFNETTGDLARDLQAANAENKTLAIFWEQRGCVYCEKMHKLNLKIEGTVSFIRKSFYVVMLNMRGERPMKDFDGAAMSEAKLARKHRVSGTPTIEFRNDQGTEVFRVPGYAEPVIFHGIFDYVASAGYKFSALGPWLKAKYLGNQQSDG